MYVCMYACVRACVCVCVCMYVKLCMYACTHKHKQNMWSDLERNIVLCVDNRHYPFNSRPMVYLGLYCILA